MSASRGKCRAHTAARDGNPQGHGCRAAVDCIVLQRVENPEHPRNFRYAKVGLCKFHTQQWLNWLAGSAEPVGYVLNKPRPVAQLEDVPPPEGLLPEASS